MSQEITIKDIWDRIENIRTELGNKIDKVSNDFHNFEAGKLTQALQDIATLNAERDALKENNDRDGNSIEELKKFMWQAGGIISLLALMMPFMLHWLKLI